MRQPLNWLQDLVSMQESLSSAEGAPSEPMTIHLPGGVNVSGR